MNVARNTQVVCVALTAVQRVEIPNLGIVVELQQKGYCGVFRVLINDDSVLITILLLLLDGCLCW